MQRSTAKPWVELPVQLKRGRGDYIHKVVKIMIKKPIETADPSYWELTDSGLTTGDPVA